MASLDACFPYDEYHSNVLETKERILGQLAICLLAIQFWDGSYLIYLQSTVFDKAPEWVEVVVDILEHCFEVVGF